MRHDCNINGGDIYAMIATIMVETSETFATHAIVTTSTIIANACTRFRQF